jgi:hypothetical protein
MTPERAAGAMAQICNLRGQRNSDSGGGRDCHVPPCGHLLNDCCNVLAMEISQTCRGAVLCCWEFLAVAGQRLAGVGSRGNQEIQAHFIASLR